MARDRPPTKKRRISQHHDASQDATAAASEPITNCRELQDAMAYTGAGIRRVRDFLNRCSNGPADIDETEVTRNRAILREYLELQMKRAKATSAEDAEEDASGAFADVAQMWAYAFQNNSQQVMTMIPATLAILVRTCSYNEELRPHGIVLIKSILQQANLKIIYRCLTGVKEHHKSPCLRLLTEMNRFDFGAMCGAVHSAFDFTIKDLVKNFDASKAAKGEVEDPARPSIRTLAVRFYVSFLQNAEPSVRSEVLGLRTWVNAIFKHVKTDIPAVVSELLDTLSKKVLQDKEIARPVKTNFFNEHVLGNIQTLYSRDEEVKISRAGKEEERTVASLVHEFLMQACTTRSNGICFPDQGWYPPGYTDSDAKRRGAHKVFNRALASFASSVRPYADELQLDLLLAIFKAAPELVAEYFTANMAFGFEPKLTTTWIGYCTFLTGVVGLPVPEMLGATAALTMPPPVDIVVENILPKPLTKPIMTKCLGHEVSLIRFFSTRLLITAFQKLQSVLKTLDEVSESIHDPQGNWIKFRVSVVEEFCKRVPDVSACAGSLGTSKASNIGLMQSEAQARLLAEYYTTIPEVALASKLEINNALAVALDTEESDPAKRGMRLLEMGHLLRIANELPDTKWWNKTPSMKHSPFVSVLKHCCASATKVPSQQVRDLLHTCAATTHIFQTETVVSPIDALLDSLSAVSSPTVFEAILTFLDEVVARCVRQPFKYLDDFTQLAISQIDPSAGPTVVDPVSPVIMTLAEQWKFFAASKDATDEQKLGGAVWLRRFLDACALLGENTAVLGILCERLSNDSTSKKMKDVFLQGKRMMGGSMKIKLQNEPKDVEVSCSGGRALTDKAIVLDTGVFQKEIELLQSGASEASLFKLATALRAAVDVVRAGPEGDNAPKVFTQVCEAIKIRILRLLGKGEDSIDKTKKLVAGDAKTWRVALGQWNGTLQSRCDIFTGFADILVTCLDEDDELYKLAKGDMLKLMVEIGLGTAALGAEEAAKLFASFNSICLLGLASEDFDTLVSGLSSAQDNEVVSQFIAFLFRRASHTGKDIGVEALGSILQSSHLAAPTAVAIAAYITSSDADDLEGVEYAPASHDFNHAPIECAFIRTLPAFRSAALKAYIHQVERNELAAVPDGFFAALVEAYSTHNSDLNKYVWNDSADADVQGHLSNILRTILPHLLEEPLDQSQVELFVRAASLIDVFDKEEMLAHIAKDRKKANLSDRLVALLEVLIQDEDEIEATGMKSWFLMAFDHLTRRFAEDAVLSAKVLGFAKALGQFLERKEVSIESIVPRAALNAVLEAALGKHIGVQEVVEFANTIITLAPSTHLEISKFLQTTLTHPSNPLHTRTSFSSPSALHHAIAYLLHRLFILGNSSSVANLTTLDATLLLYRGLSDATDSLLLDIMIRIESHLARSCASRISSWSVVEQADTTPLVSQVRGKLAVTVDQKVLQRSIYNMPLRSPGFKDATATSGGLRKLLEAVEQESQEAIMGGGEGEEKLGGYDPRFLLPVLMHMLMMDEAGGVDVVQAIEKGCVGYAIMALAHADAVVNQMAVLYLGAVVSKLQATTIRPKTQLIHHLSALLASLESNSTDSTDSATTTTTTTNPSAPSTLPLLYLAVTLPLLLTPHHFFYPHHLELLLSSPLVPLDDVPFPITLIAPDSDSPHRHIAFSLNLLAAGLRTPTDLEVYRKRNVVPAVLELYASPYVTSGGGGKQRGADPGAGKTDEGKAKGSGSNRIKEKVLELLWNMAGIEGGGTTLITRHGVFSWIEGQIADEADEDVGLTLRRLAARIWESCDQRYVQEWSHGGIRTRLVDREGVFSRNRSVE